MSENIIILRSVYGKVGQKYFITPCRDPKTGRFPSCVRSVDSKGDMILSDIDKNSSEPLIPENKVYTIQDGEQFDLSDPWKEAEWESIKNAPIIAPARDARDEHGNLLIDGPVASTRAAQMRARYGVAELYVETPGIDAAQRIEKKKLVFNAESYIYNDEKGAEGRVKIARLLGKNMKGAPDADVTDFLLKTAAKYPKKVIDVYTGSDAAIRLLFIEAKEKHIIRIKDKVYYYGDESLGMTDDAVIAYMKLAKHKGIVNLITKDTFPEMEPEIEPKVEVKTEPKEVSEKPKDTKTNKK